MNSSHPPDGYRPRWARRPRTVSQVSTLRLILYVVLSMMLTPWSTAWAGTLLAGAAKAELTPPMKVPLAGYSRRKGKPATGVHDAPEVRALVVQEDGTTLAIASCDLLIIDEEFFEAVRQRVRAMRPDLTLHLLIAATHTHSGPGAYGQHYLEKLSMGHFDPAVFEFLSTRIAHTIVDASQRLQPAVMSDGVITTSGLVNNRMIPGGPSDEELSVVGVFDLHQHPLAVLTNFGAHPTTLGAWNRQLSADYPGVLARALEQRFPSAVCLFLVGAVGDQAPAKHGDGFGRAEWLGQALAQQAAGVLEQAAPVAGDGVRVAEAVMPLPPAQLRIGALHIPRWLGQPLVDDDASLIVTAVGRVMLIGAPCDLSTELGQALKAYARRLGYRPLVVGFANDYIGYCMPERLYWAHRYEATMAFNGPKTGELLVAQLERLMTQVSGK